MVLTLIVAVVAFCGGAYVQAKFGFEAEVVSVVTSVYAEVKGFIVGIYTTVKSWFVKKS